MPGHTEASVVCRLACLSLHCTKRVASCARRSFQLFQPRSGQVRCYATRDAPSVPKVEMPVSRLSDAAVRGTGSVWSQSEDESLKRAFYDGMTSQETSTRILPQRSAQAIYDRRLQLGLRKTKGRSKSRLLQQLLRDLHSQGLTTRQMQDYLRPHNPDVRESSVPRMLALLGLHPNGDGAGRTSPRKRYTAEEKQIIRAGVEQGWTADEFKRHLPGKDIASIQTARWRYQQLRIEVPNANRAWTSDELRALVEHRTAGLSYGDIAMRLGRTLKAIQSKWTLLNKRNEVDG